MERKIVIKEKACKDSQPRPLKGDQNIYQEFEKIISMASLLVDASHLISFAVSVSETCRFRGDRPANTNKSDLCVNLMWPYFFYY